MTKAAQRLGRVQSNITTRIQQLEEDLGVALFVRDSKKMILSPEGESFLSYTNKILSLAKRRGRRCIRVSLQVHCIWAQWKPPPSAA
ncbi:HTH-type transcriptional regulator YofA [Cedecea neteri]|uniref:HTH-type transcriptional regulator YofA n=1 Tax=Cedecea neteri TaxID=158822 RepID=A0A2X3JGE6_9ENTR|nr:HTH-type transcriptional regulator YofA [Cedecea neteri]